MIEVCTYNDKFSNDVKELLVELQDYHANIDNDNIMHGIGDYKDQYFSLVYNLVKEKEGQIFLALLNKEVVGLTICHVDNLPFGQNYVSNCPKRGRILKLIIKQSNRGKHIGSILLEKAEEYLKSIDCKYIDIDVFGTNETGLKFYKSKGYVIRTYKVIKKI